MNTNKLIKSLLLSLTLLSAAAPALGMENSSKNKIEKEEKQEAPSTYTVNSNPTFGKLLNRKVWETVVNLKEVIANQEGIRAMQPMPADVFEMVLLECLTNTEIDSKVRANVALEFLADPEYEFLHSHILSWIRNAGLVPHTYSQAIELDYPQEVLIILKPIISSIIMKAVIADFSDEKDLDIPRVREIAGNLRHIDTIWSLLTRDNYMKLLYHMFNSDLKKYAHRKMNAVLSYYKTIIINSRHHKVDLNFENKDGLTPLMWTIENAPDNGHTIELQKVLVLSGALINYKNREGKTFANLIDPVDLKRLQGEVKPWPSIEEYVNYWESPLFYSKSRKKEDSVFDSCIIQ